MKYMSLVTRRNCWPEICFRGILGAWDAFGTKDEEFTPCCAAILIIAEPQQEQKLQLCRVQRVSDQSPHSLL